MAYTVILASSAVRQLESLQKKEQIRLKKRIDAENPYPSDVKKLKHSSSFKGDLYRIRVGSFRVIYTIQNNQLIVFVVKIGHRREIYQKL